MNTTEASVSGGSHPFMATLARRPALPSAPTIGVVVPVYNEAAILSRSLERLRATLEGEPGVVVPFSTEPPLLPPPLEPLRATLEGEPVVVVDAGSRDGSAQIARRFFHTESEPEPNRGAQLNHGALCLSTDVLLFLHADSQLPAGFQTLIRTALLDPDVVGGCFRLQLD